VQVDGFRFDIMGHHFVHNMTNIRNAINALTPERDGVDGRHLYIYGEAWDFGEVALNQRGRNASQHNLGGSRIGAFNDRCVQVYGSRAVEYVSHLDFESGCRKLW
jgi:pullulanase/glycogen debranching enzyme